MPQQGIAQVVRGLPQSNDPNLIVGTEGNSDAGVYRLRADLLIVQSLDFFPPLVDDPFSFGQIAAANALSDVFAMGASPKTALNIVGFPDNELELEILERILAGGAERVGAAGAVIAGGHTVRDTEIKYGLSVTGVVDPARLITNQRAQPGDRLVLTKALGTGFITTANKAGRAGSEVIDAAIRSMITLNAAASQAAVACHAHAATDVTGFGLAGHALEMAQASHVTLRLHAAGLPTLPGAVELVTRANTTRASATNRQFAATHIRWELDEHGPLIELMFDPQTSGGLLVSVPPSQVEAFCDRARDQGAPVAEVVGEVEPSGSHALIID